MAALGLQIDLSLHLKANEFEVFLVNKSSIDLCANLSMQILRSLSRIGHNCHIKIRFEICESVHGELREIDAEPKAKPPAQLAAASTVPLPPVPAPAACSHSHSVAQKDLE